MSTYSIPEMLGMPPVPFDREQLYSAPSYQAMYVLTEEEARDILETHTRHSSVDLALSNRYVKDEKYRARVDEACADLTATPPSKEVQAIMDRLSAKLKAGGKLDDILGGAA